MYHCVHGFAYRTRDFWSFLVLLLHRKYDGQSRFVTVRILCPRYINPITYVKKSQIDFYRKTQSRITYTPYRPVYLSSSVYCWKFTPKIYRFSGRRHRAMFPVGLNYCQYRVTPSEYCRLDDSVR